MALTPEHAIDVVTKVFGRHPGFRALHAKGVVLKGTFTAAPEAAELTRAAHMQGGDPVPATFRVSNGGGNPHHPDWAPDPRGLAVKFYLPDGSRTDIVAVSSPLFPTRTPEGFVELIAAQGAGAAAAWKMPLFLARHPEALRVIPVVAPTLRPPRATPRFRTTGSMPSNGPTPPVESATSVTRFLPEAPGASGSSREAKRRGARPYLGSRRSASGWRPGRSASGSRSRSRRPATRSTIRARRGRRGVGGCASGRSRSPASTTSARPAATCSSSTRRAGHRRDRGLATRSDPSSARCVHRIGQLRRTEAVMAGKWDSRPTCPTRAAASPS